MRTLSQTIKDVLAADYGQTKDVVIITVPAQTNPTVYPETILYLANGEGVFIDGHEYQPSLRKLESIKFSLGKAPDNAEFSIENVSLSLGFTLTDFQRALDGCKVEIKRAFKTTVGWEADSLFTGYIKSLKVDQSEIAISATSDMSRRGTSVAGVTVTQRCLLKFNAYGDGRGPICGWQTTQPGNIATCDKGLDTPNGCQSHGNQHRFGGVPAFTSITNGTGYDDGGFGWGNGGGGGWCITLDSWVLVEVNGTKCWKVASTLQEGDFIISVDKFGRYVPTKVVKATIGETSTLYMVSTTKGYSLHCSPTHQIMVDVSREDGTPVNTLKIGDEVAVYDFKSHANFKDTIESIERYPRDTKVLLLELEEPYHLFIAGKTKEGAIVSHNLKPAFSDPFNGGGYNGGGNGGGYGWDDHYSPEHGLVPF